MRALVGYLPGEYLRLYDGIRMDLYKTQECEIYPLFRWALHNDKSQTYSQFMDGVKRKNCPVCRKAEGCEVFNEEKGVC